VVVAGLTCLLGAAGCKTFTSTAEDMEGERRFAQESQKNFWGGRWWPFVGHGYSPGCDGGWGIDPDLHPLAAGPADARPWVGNAVAGGLTRNPRCGR
jgi:hypothetical protein